MAPTKWDEEEDSTPPSSPPQGPAIARRGKFDDEEGDSDVADNWEEAEDSEVEREKAKKAAEAKARADAEAAKNKKSKAQRIEERRVENMRKKLDAEDEEESSESETERRARLRRTEQAADLKHAEDLFGGIGVKKKATNKAVISLDPKDPTKTVNLASLPLFKPSSKDDFVQLREVLAPIFQSNSHKAQYTLFMQDFVKDILRDLPSDQIKKIGSSITALSNEKLKEEKAADKTGKKSKAAKSKATLVANRDTAKADTTSYADYELDE